MNFERATRSCSDNTINDNLLPVVFNSLKQLLWKCPFYKEDQLEITNNRNRPDPGTLGDPKEPLEIVPKAIIRDLRYPPLVTSLLASIKFCPCSLLDSLLRICLIWQILRFVYRLDIYKRKQLHLYCRKLQLCFLFVCYI